MLSKHVMMRPRRLHRNPGGERRAYEHETVDRGDVGATGEAGGVSWRAGGLPRRAGGLPWAAAGPSSRAMGGACGGVGKGEGEPRGLPGGCRLGGGSRRTDRAARAAACRAEAAAAGQEVRERLAAARDREPGSAG